MSPKISNPREAKPNSGALPSREELLAFLAGKPGPNGETPPARVTKRDIARVFGVKGEGRRELKSALAALEADGAITRGRKTLQARGRLPGMLVADIVERGRDGELIARPSEWTEPGEPPRIAVRVARTKRDKAPAPGLGARVLLRIDPQDDAGGHSGRVVKILDKARARALGVYRALDNGGGRVLAIEKKASGREISFPPAWPAAPRTANSSRWKCFAKGASRRRRPA